ncbi:hypothetical protein OROGR_008671 [Orobanche gracilis]
MGPKKDTEEEITWTNDNIINFCEVCIDYITKNGRGQLMRWRNIEELFTKKTNKQCNFKSLKNKFDSMKKEWRLWKFLKTGETDLGWNSTTGKLNCPDEWWEKKLKEKPKAKKYRYKGVCPQVEAKWDELFGDAVATRVGCIAPSLDREFVEKSTNDVEEIETADGWSNEAFREYSQYSRLESLDTQENSFWHNFSAEITDNLPTRSDVPKVNKKSVKCRKRESGGSVLMREHIEKVHEIHSDIVGLIKQGPNTKKNDTGASIDQIMDNRIATTGNVEVGGDIWCHAMLMFRDAANREIFFKMPGDDARLAWLKFVHQRNTI